MDQREPVQILWVMQIIMRVKGVQDGVGVVKRSCGRGTYGTISSCRPLRKRMGTLVMVGSTDSLPQIW